MAETIRIRTTPNGEDNYIKVKIEQDFDFLEILSLNINQEDAYTKFSSDYGVIVGRVIVNGGFGVPNAKVSVFVPLDDIDAKNPVIKGLYPYKNISDLNDDGIRYNLLTKDPEAQNNCFTPVGTFPAKREVLDNETIKEVYDKYYKYTTTTNHAGDFMIFGVPLGQHTVHVDVDISDIDILSQRPYDLISKGAPISKFDSSVKFSKGKNLDNLVQIKTASSGINVQPFWGDTENYEIGITRMDFNLNYEITPSAIFIGNIFGDQDKHSVSESCSPRGDVGKLGEQIAGIGRIRMIRKTIEGGVEEFNVEGGELIDEFGTWAYQVPMNLDYMVTDEFGNLVMSDDANKGIPTRARVRFNIGMHNVGESGTLRTRANYLVPNNPKTTSEVDYEFGIRTKNESFRDMYWNKIYTVKNFIPRFQKQGSTYNTKFATGIKDVDGDLGNKLPFPYNRLNTQDNALLLIMCLLIYIIGFVVSIINSLIIPIINLVIVLIMGALFLVCGILDTIFGIIDAIWSAIP